MIQGWLIYNKEDYIKNEYFASELISCGKDCGIELELVLRERITLGMAENILYAAHKGIKSFPKLIINRSRDNFLAKHFELMGVRVYNSSEVSYICNHKARTHQLISQLNIPAVNTIFGSKQFFKSEELRLDYPVVVKSASGHGGTEVFRCTNPMEIASALDKIKEDAFLIQQLCGMPGIDIRAFVLGKQILGAIKRESKVDFKSNYSLGGEAMLYQLSKKDEDNILKISCYLKSDFVGIDFIVDEKGKLLFNEVEDVVGSRTLYAYGQINTAREYIKYIKSTARL